MAALTKKASAILDTLAGAGNSGAYVNEIDVQPLIKKGFVEINADMRDGSNNVAARLTEAGRTAVGMAGEDHVQATTTVTNIVNDSATDPGVDVVVSDIVADVPKPRSTRSKRGSKYPFDQLAVGGSFFVAATGKHPRPARSLGSQVSQANRRYAEETGEMTLNRNGKEVPELRFTRKFSCIAVSDGAPWGFPGHAGAAVYRDE